MSRTEGLIEWARKLRNHSIALAEKEREMTRYTVLESQEAKVFRVYRISGQGGAIIEEICRCDTQENASFIQQLLEQAKKVQEEQLRGKNGS